MVTRSFALVVALALALPAAAHAERLVALTYGTGVAELTTFDSASPSTTRSVTVTGIDPAQRLLTIDARPATGQLYGVAATSAAPSNSQAFTYVINPDTGQATLLGATGTTLAGWGNLVAGSDFNPVVDRLRIVNVNADNERLNPNNGALVSTDTALNPGGPQMIDVAYDRNTASATATALFGIDRSSSSLGRIGGPDGSPSANGGVVTQIGPLGVTVDAASSGGFDISGASGVAYAAFSISGAGASVGLYTINLTTGAATLVGAIGNGAVAVYGLAQLPDPAPGPTGPQGPAGPQGPTGATGKDGAGFTKLAVAIAQGSYTGHKGKKLSVRIVSTLAGVAKLQVLKGGKEKAKVSDTIKAGRSTLKIAKLPAKGSYTLKLTVTGGSQTATDTASLKVKK